MSRREGTIAERVVQAAFSGKEAVFFQDEDNNTEPVYEFTPDGIAQYLQINNGGSLTIADEATFNELRVSESVNVVTTSGYYEPGDGGGHTKIRIEEPDIIQPWHSQSGDGSWWEVSRNQDITPEIFGARGNGSANDKTKFEYAFSFLGDEGGVLLLRNGPYRINGTLEVNYPITIRGTSREVQMVIYNSNTEEGLKILHSDVVVEGFTIAANASSGITNGTGHCGTCITISNWFTHPDLPEPSLVKNIVIRDMSLIRLGTFTAHALSIMARSSHILVENVDFVGAGSNTTTGEHGDAVLTHWGAHSMGVSTGALKTSATVGTLTRGDIFSNGAVSMTLVEPDSGIMYVKEVVGTPVHGAVYTNEDATASFTVQGSLFVTAIDFNTQTANFTTGTTVTGGTSGATANISAQYDAGTTGTLFLTSVNGTFQSGELLTTSGGSATASGATYSGLRQSPFEPGHYSFHPNNVRIRNVRLRNTGRLIACSASYSIDIDGVDYLGPAQGGQLFDLPMGDEAGTYACEEDYGRVYNGFSMKNVRAKMITGTGSNAVTVIDCSGFCTSKQSDASLAAYASAPYTTEPYAGRVQPRRRQFKWKNVVIENLTWDAGPSTPPSSTPYVRQIWFRNLVADISFKNVNAVGRNSVLSLTVSNCLGNYTFDNCDFYGGVSVDATDMIKFTDCRIEHPDINTSTSVVYINGSLTNITTSGTTAALATSLSVPGGLTVRVNKGAKITYSGGIVYCSEYGETGDTVLNVTPLPVASTAAEVFVIDTRNKSSFEDCDIKGGNRGFELNFAITKIRGCTIRDAGQYGIMANTGTTSSLSVENTTFSNNGQRRATIPADSGLATRDIILSVGYFTGRGLRFEDSKYISTNFISQSTMTFVSLRDSVFIGTPITSKISVAVLSSGKSVVWHGNVDATGAGVYRAATWTPVVKLNATNATITTTSATYIVYDNVVHFDMNVTLTAKNAGVGAVTITGLPFTQSGTSVAPVRLTVMTGLTGTPLAYIASNVINLEQTSATGTSTIADTNMNDTTDIKITGTYRISA